MSDYKTTKIEAAVIPPKKFEHICKIVQNATFPLEIAKPNETPAKAA